jgi:hypothetical protein
VPRQQKCDNRHYSVYENVPDTFDDVRQYNRHLRKTTLLQLSHSSCCNIGYGVQTHDMSYDIFPKQLFSHRRRVSLVGGWPRVLHGGRLIFFQKLRAERYENGLYRENDSVGRPGSVASRKSKRSTSKTSFRSVEGRTSDLDKRSRCTFAFLFLSFSRAQRFQTPPIIRSMMPSAS